MDEHQSKSTKSARFQVATAQVDPDGLLQIALVAFDLKAKADFTQVLFFRFSSNSTSLKYAAGLATILEAALEDQREAIAERLAGYRSAYVAEVKFPPPTVRVSSSKGLTRLIESQTDVRVELASLAYCSTRRRKRAVPSRNAQSWPNVRPCCQTGNAAA